MTRLRQPGVLGAILNRDRRTWRAFVLFAIIAALLSVAVAAASPSHFHTKTTTSCDVCLTASLAAGAQVAAVHTFAVPQTRSIAVVPVSSSLYNLLRFHASQTRGPPALAL